MASPAPTRISKKEAAERLGCSTRKIDRLRAAGELVAVKSSREQQGHVAITLDSLQAHEQRQLEAAQPRPARDDIKARFPIPEQDREREAKNLQPWSRAAAAPPQPHPNAPTAQKPLRSPNRIGPQPSAAPSERQLAQAERALRKRPLGASKAVGGGIHMRLDREGRRRFQFRLRSSGHGCRSGQPGGTYDSWQAACEARLAFELVEAEAALGITASAAAMRNFEIDLYAEKVWWPDCTIHLAVETRLSYRGYLKNLLPHIKGITLAQLENDRQLVTQITHALVADKTYIPGDGEKPDVYKSAVDHALQVLSVIYEHAVEAEVIALNPLAGRRRLNRRRGTASKSAPSHRPILKSEVKLPHTAALVGSGMRGDPVLILQRRLIPELIVMGMRPSDILAMRPRWWRDKHGPRQLLHIDSSVKDLAGHLIEDEPKTGERDLYLIPAVAEWLELLYQLQDCPDLDSLNFPNRNGGLLDWGNFRSGVWYPALHRAGITDTPKASDPEAFYPYLLRHVGVTLMARAERPEGGTYARDEVADQFGHTVPTLDRVYNHVLKNLDGVGGLTMDQIIRNARRHVWGPLPGDLDYQEDEYDLLEAAELTGKSRNALAAQIQRGSIPGTKRKCKLYVTKFDLAWHGLIGTDLGCPPPSRASGRSRCDYLVSGASGLDRCSEGSRRAEAVRKSGDP